MVRASFKREEDLFLLKCLLLIFFTAYHICYNILYILNSAKKERNILTNFIKKLNKDRVCCPQFKGKFLKLILTYIACNSISCANIIIKNETTK